jgi:putative SbcD/Mre11-related phosphoesterase
MRKLRELEDGLINVDGLPVIYHKKSNSLILADIHLGYEDYMASLGVFLPKLQLKIAIETIEEAIKSINNKVKIVIAGDVKHVFEKLTRQEKVEITKLVEHLSSLGPVKEIILVRGNHDTFVAPLLRRLGVNIEEDHLKLDEKVGVIHGHKRPSCDCEVLVMGHEHASILVDVGGARTKLPVLLRVPLETGGRAYVLPPTGIYQTGNNISLSRSSYLSPIIKEEGKVEDAMVWVVDREYGTVKLAELKYVLEAALF